MSPEYPRISLVAGESTCFRLTPERRKPTDAFNGRISETVRHHGSICEVTTGPGFSGHADASCSAHRTTIGRFSTSIFKLLEQRLSVHIKLSLLQDHGIPQDRKRLIIVASPFCASLLWDLNWPVTGPRPPVKIKDLNEDLTSENPRATQWAEGGFVYSVPVQSNPASAAAGNRQIKYI